MGHTFLILFFFIFHFFQIFGRKGFAGKTNRHTWWTSVTSSRLIKIIRYDHHTTLHTFKKQLNLQNNKIIKHDKIFSNKLFLEIWLLPGPLPISHSVQAFNFLRDSSEVRLLHNKIMRMQNYTKFEWKELFSFKICVNIIIFIQILCNFALSWFWFFELQKSKSWQCKFTQNFNKNNHETNYF